MPTMGFFL